MFENSSCVQHARSRRFSQGGASRDISYGELHDDVSRFAGALADLGVTKGDRVLIYMPMVPEAIVAMLATVRLGAVHSVGVQLTTQNLGPANLCLPTADLCCCYPLPACESRPEFDPSLEQSSVALPRKSWPCALPTLDLR